MFDPAYSLFDVILVLWVVLAAVLGAEAKREKNRSPVVWYIVGCVSSPLLGWFILKKFPKKPDPPRRFRFSEMMMALAFVILAAACSTLIPVSDSPCPGLLR